MNWDSLKEGFELIGLGMLGSVLFGVAFVTIYNRLFPKKPPYTTKAFRNNNKQAITIPAEIAYEQADIELDIQRVGDELRIRPHQPVQ